MKRARLVSVFMLAACVALVTAVEGQSGFTGTWITHNFGTTPNLIDLQANGTTVTGTINRDMEVMSISGGRISGNTVTFNAASPDERRVIAFTGRLDGDQMSFTRSVQVRVPPADGAGIYGGQGPMAFVATRAASTGLPIPRALLGNWRLDLARSTYEPGPAQNWLLELRSFVLQPDGGLGFAFIQLSPQGTPVIQLAMLKTDGKDYPLHSGASLANLFTTGTEVVGTRALRMVGERSLELIMKNSQGVVTTTRKLAVSPDGNTLTDVWTIVNAQGQTTATNTLVSERMGAVALPATN